MNFAYSGHIPMIEIQLALNNGKTPLPRGQWSAMNSDSVARYDATMAYYNGELFVFGGRGNAQTGILNTIRKFNLATNTWSAVTTNLPSARQGFTATVIGTKIYLYGGANNPTKYGDLFSFDPATNVLSTLAPGLACNGHVAVTYQGELYVFGGQPTNTSTPPVNTLRKYNPGTNSWTTLTPGGITPSGRFYAAGGVANEIFHIAGGSTLSSTVVQGMDRYDFANNVWLPQVPLAETQLAAAGIGIGNRLYVIGGNPLGGSSVDYTNRTRGYDTTLENWSVLADHPTTAGYIACCIDDTGKVYSFGGYNGAILSNLSQYIPQ